MAEVAVRREPVASEALRLSAELASFATLTRAQRISILTEYTVSVLPQVAPLIVRTVLGDVSPQDLGVVLPHEHLLMDLTPIFTEPTDPEQTKLAYAPITLENVGWVRMNYASNLENIRLDDEQCAIEEVRRFRSSGGRTIVELTSIGCGRDPDALARIAAATGAHIVMGTGYYVQGFQPPEVALLSEEEIGDVFVREIVEGAGNTGIRAGIIGEIGCSWPLTAPERKVLRAAARAQRLTGAAITVHPGRNPAAPFEILDAIAEAGGDVGRTVICHLDRTIADLEMLAGLAETGCYLEYDMFGNESAYYPFAPVDMPNDGTRIDRIAHLIEHGYGDRILISHDIGYKTFLVRYGGGGYAHILENAVPKMAAKGLGRAEIDALLVENPARLLALDEARVAARAGEVAAGTGAL